MDNGVVSGFVITGKVVISDVVVLSCHWIWVTAIAAVVGLFVEINRVIPFDVVIRSVTREVLTEWTFICFVWEIDDDTDEVSIYKMISIISATRDSMNYQKQLFLQRSNASVWKWDIVLFTWSCSFNFRSVVQFLYQLITFDLFCTARAYIDTINLLVIKMKE